MQAYEGHVEESYGQLSMLSTEELPSQEALCQTQGQGLWG